MFLISESADLCVRNKWFSLSLLNSSWFVLGYVYSKQPIFGLTQEWLRELSFSRLEYGVHDRLHISSAEWWDILLPLTPDRRDRRLLVSPPKDTGNDG